MRSPCWIRRSWSKLRSSVGFDDVGTAETFTQLCVAGSHFSTTPFATEVITKLLVSSPITSDVFIIIGSGPIMEVSK